SILVLTFFLSLLPPPPTSTLFPYTTLFRSRRMAEDAHVSENFSERFALQNTEPDPNIGGIESPDPSVGIGFRVLKREAFGKVLRSEEHTSELQSLAYLVCRLLLEKIK